MYLNGIFMLISLPCLIIILQISYNFYILYNLYNRKRVHFCLIWILQGSLKNALLKIGWCNPLPGNLWLSDKCHWPLFLFEIIVRLATWFPIVTYNSGESKMLQIYYISSVIYLVLLSATKLWSDCLLQNMMDHR